MEQPQPDHDGHDHIVVRSSLTPEGEYVTVVEVTPDDVFTLNRKQAFTYAEMVIDALVRAGYDASVAAQWKSVSNGEASEPLIGGFIIELRDRRLPPITGFPIRYEPIVSATTGKPYVHVYLADRPICQWSVHDAMDHVMGVLVIASGIEFDGHYFEVLKKVGGVSDDMARVLVSDLGRYQEWFNDDE